MEKKSPAAVNRIWNEEAVGGDANSSRE